jgi:hypothetical protein
MGTRDANLDSRSAVTLQIAKLAVLAGKVIEFEISSSSSSQKEKISFSDALVLLGFFRA